MANDDLITVSRAAIVQAMNLALLDVTPLDPATALTIADGKATELTIAAPARYIGALAADERLLAMTTFGDMVLVATDRRVLRVVGDQLVELRLMQLQP